ncbi:MAG: hypothetical protein HPY55_05680 [Firmicutes bacterium]|nr:hypothetical protein [Bacillota bacterium]
MELVLVVLNKGERLDPILEAFVKLGIRGATVIDGMGYGERTLYRLGRLTFIRGQFSGMLESKPKHRVIMSLVESHSQAEAAAVAVEGICGKPPGTKALVIILPALGAYVFGHDAKPGSDAK